MLESPGALDPRTYTASAGPLLGVSALNAWYGESHVLHGVAFEVLPGEVVTLLGRNGAGKTTTLKSIMGIVPRREGSIVYEGRETSALPSNRIARLGIAYCPEERGIFASLNVEENLLLPPMVREGGLSVKTVRYIHTTIHKALEDAVDAGVVARNAAARAKPPRPSRRSTRQVGSWGPSELAAFLDFLETRPCATACPTD